MLDQYFTDATHATYPAATWPVECPKIAIVLAKLEPALKALPP